MKCPACGASHDNLRLWAMVDLQLYLREDGVPDGLDLDGWSKEDILENIKNDDMEVQCKNCGALFYAKFSDGNNDAVIEIGEEVK